MIRRLFRWAFYGAILLVLLLVAGILLLDTIVKETLQSQIRSKTGMDVKIGRVAVGLISPTVSVENFTLYSPADFGGSPCLVMPELFVEYDRAALGRGMFRLKLVRIHVAEISFVKNAQGRLNFQKKSKPASGSRKSGSRFAGIDTLNLTLGKARLSSLESSFPTREVDFALKNEVFRNLKSEADAAGILLVLAGRGGLDLFSDPKKAPGASEKTRDSIQVILKTLFPL